MDDRLSDQHRENMNRPPTNGPAAGLITFAAVCFILGIVTWYSLDGRERAYAVGIAVGIGLSLLILAAGRRYNQD